MFIVAGDHIQHNGDEATPLTPLTLKTVGAVLDVVPTLFALKGIPLGRDFDGGAMTDIIDAGWLAKTPIRHIDTHDSEEWLAARRARIREAIAQSERLDQLRSLGYIR